MRSILRLGSVGLTVLTFPLMVFTGESAAMPAANAVVAAGFGFQDENTSFITVKTYNAQSGEVLSAETYELDIKDDGPSSSHPRTRIFAGGVGIGTGNLSEFTLRVYDASNGRFLWEGRLNLTVGDHSDMTTHRVAAHVQPKARVTRTAVRANDAGQPYFVLRARNPQTGQLVWSDEFSTETAPVRIERISRSVIGMAGTAPRDIDFRIKMPDLAGRLWLWEDKVEPAEEDEESSAERSDDTGGFSGNGGQSTMPSHGHPATAPASGIETDHTRERVRLESPLPGFGFS
jgi:hypothetical protein